METIALILSSISIVGLCIVGPFLRRYLPSYLMEKGKNLASKEDIAQITELVENVKAQHTADAERLRATLLSEGQVIERHRRIYEDMCAALRIFISGHGGTQEAKEQFHAAHAAAWLWASDEVVIALNHFIELQAQYAADARSVDQPRLKSAYAAVVIAMRKDAGFPATSVVASDYQFVHF